VGWREQDYAELLSNASLDNKNTEIAENFRQLVRFLQLPSKESDSDVLVKKFISGNGLSKLMLSGETANQKTCHQMVNLHDLWANALLQNSTSFIGGIELRSDQIVSRILHSLLVALAATQTNQNLASSLMSVAKAAGTAMSAYSFMYPEPVETFVKSLAEMVTIDSRIQLGDAFLTSVSSTKGKESLIRAVFNYSHSSEEVFSVLGSIPSQMDVYRKLLLSLNGLAGVEASGRAVCYVSRIMDTDNYIKLFIQVLRLWADPVIAKAHVAQEVLHFSRLLFMSFVHLDENEVVKNKMSIVEQLGKGLPNHFNSTDYRTVKLAQMICDLLTETLKHLEAKLKGAPVDEKDPDRPMFKVASYLDDGLCYEVIRQYCNCCERAKSFWMGDGITKSLKDLESTTCNETKGLAKSTHNLRIDNSASDVDSDDDDDLEAIESLEAPPSAAQRVTYVRDFLDGEFKTYDDMENALRSLPQVIRHQLPLEHEELSLQVLEKMFRWENEYDVASLDMFRHQSLCSILKSTMGQPKICQQFCRYFHVEHVQPFRKNLILDVLSNVAKELPLKDSLCLARTAFDIILNNDLAITSQDPAVKVPMILFFSRLLSHTLPKQLVEEEMVVNYLRCLNKLSGGSVEADGSTTESVRYAVFTLSEVIQQLQSNSLRQPSSSSSLHASISDTKTWLANLQQATTIDTL